MKPWTPVLDTDLGVSQSLCLDVSDGAMLDSGDMSQLEPWDLTC